ncbi:uncharacterized protein BcabD6B2_57050 [Babesia caballi]|uniref:Uncharacterized protein n=1 Tax=Babesia caballi TaxID=5871 RepID=A0AAV4M608_BABCB|nr:hypothetical protein BcabD6B2_57050 [Babesia caballi]
MSPWIFRVRAAHKLKRCRRERPLISSASSNLVAHQDAQDAHHTVDYQLAQEVVEVRGRVVENDGLARCDVVEGAVRVAVEGGVDPEPVQPFVVLEPGVERTEVVGRKQVQPTRRSAEHVHDGGPEAVVQSVHLRIKHVLEGLVVVDLSVVDYDAGGDGALVEQFGVEQLGSALRDDVGLGRGADDVGGRRDIWEEDVVHDVLRRDIGRLYLRGDRQRLRLANAEQVPLVGAGLVARLRGPEVLDSERGHVGAQVAETARVALLGGAGRADDDHVDRRQRAVGLLGAQRTLQELRPARLRLHASDVLSVRQPPRSIEPTAATAVAGECVAW